MSRVSDIINCSIKYYLTRFGFEFSPFSLVWNITWLCNAQCIICKYGENYEQYKKDRKRELSKEEIKNIIREFKYLGCRRISFSGGEPLLKEGIFEIIKYSNNLGIKVGISSNGFIIDENISRELIKSGVNDIHISLDSPDKLHDKIRNKKDAFDMVNNAIKNLKSRIKGKDIYIGLSTVINGLNLEKIEDLCKYTMKMRLDGISFQLINPRQIRNDEYKDILLLDKVKIVELREILEKVINKYGNILRNSNQYLKMMSKIDLSDKGEKIACSAGNQQLYIFPFGEISTCNYMEKVKDLRSNTAKELIFSDEMKKIKNKVKNGMCPGCWCPATHEFNALLSIKNWRSMIKIAHNYLIN